MGVAPQQFLRLPRLPFRHFGGAEERSRTADTLIFSQVLYHLSYLGISEDSSPSPNLCQPGLLDESSWDSEEHIPSMDAICSRLVRSL